jgi:Putative prokaryotic signal transducing protein
LPLLANKQLHYGYLEAKCVTASDPSKRDLITIRTFGNEPEANIAKAALEAFGIDCLLSSDDCGGQRLHLATMGQGIRLLIRSDDAARAEDVLAGKAEQTT